MFREFAIAFFYGQCNGLWFLWMVSRGAPEIKIWRALASQVYVVLPRPWAHLAPNNFLHCPLIFLILLFFYMNMSFKRRIVWICRITQHRVYIMVSNILRIYTLPRVRVYLPLKFREFCNGHKYVITLRHFTGIEFYT